MKRIVRIGIILLSLLVVFPTMANDEIFEKEFNKSFKVNKDAQLDVKNKYGSINVKVWDKKEIKIHVIVSIEKYSNKSKATRLFKDIDVKITGGRDQVEAITSIPKFRMSNLKMNIDYTLYIPKTISLNLYQEYGNMNISDAFDGNTQLVVKYGNMNVEVLNNMQNEIKVEYGKLIADYIKNARVKISYSSLNIDGADKLSVRSQYCSRFRIDKVNYIDHQSDYDDVKIDFAKVVHIKSDYSSLNYESIEESLEAELDFGELEVEHLSKGFSLFKVSSDYAGVEVDVEDGASFQIEVFTDYGKFYCFDKKNIEKEKKSFNSYNYRGFVGNKNSASKIYITADYANIDIK